MPISQERILPGRSYRTGANELREVSAVDQDEVVYHSVFPGSAGLMVRTPDKRLALARFAAEAQSEVERPLHRPTADWLGRRDLGRGSVSGQPGRICSHHTDAPASRRAMNCAKGVPMNRTRSFTRSRCSSAAPD